MDNRAAPPSATAPPTIGAVRLTLNQLLSATGGRQLGGPSQAEFGSYHTDSREVEPGGLFFALRGAAMDGHAFVADAVRRGAAGVVIEQPVGGAGAGGVAAVLVADAWRALYDLAGWVLDRVAPVVVGVTGSNGKTSTKEMIAAVAGVRHRVLKTSGNLNTETGVPLTLLRLSTGDELAVLEMGMQGPGEIARLAALARPLVGVVTGIGCVHAEFFTDGRHGIARAKGELLAALPPNGLAVVNAEDDYRDALAARSPAPVVTYGLGAGDLRGEAYHPLAPVGSEVVVEGVRVRVGPSGRHQARNALAALAVGRFLGVPVAQGAPALAGVAVEHRLQAHPLPAGYTLVDDSYNASPESMLAAFETLAERPRSGRLLALLGEMRELGALAPSAHERVGRRAGEVFDRVAVVDVGEGRRLAEAAAADLLPDREAGRAWVREAAAPGDVVLVKASNGVALHQVVRDLLAEAAEGAAGGPGATPDGQAPGEPAG
jgi:UDP-N-acetylmuramoyl-tripeptide--D-alanyl-D-alanine ligase